MVPEADRLKFSEIRSNVATRLEGGEPRPKRKRGYYRALKRGEYWAVMEKALKDMVNENYRRLFADSSEVHKQYEDNLALYAGRYMVTKFSAEGDE